MALLVMLFAMTPSLEAMACAAEGCDVACLEQSEGEAFAGAADTSSDDCADKDCACVAGHCGHVAVPVLEVGGVSAPDARMAELNLPPEQPVAFIPQTFERPPRI